MLFPSALFAATLAAVLTAGFVAAQSPGNASPAASVSNTAAPTTPAAPTPGVDAYDSAFTGYRRWSEPQRQSWREANDEAAALGGHVGQLRGRPAAPGAERTGTHSHDGAKPPQAGGPAR